MCTTSHFTKLGKKPTRYLKKLFFSSYLFLYLITTGYTQAYIRIENRWQKDGKTSYQIHIENPTVEAGATDAGWWSAQWKIEPVNGGSFYTFRNRWNKGGQESIYLHLKGGKLQASAISPQSQEAHWMIEPVKGSSFYRIRNRTNSSSYLHIQNPTLSAGPIEFNWWSAMWKLDGFQKKTAAQSPPIKEIDATVSTVAWITRHYFFLKDKPLNQLVIPGTHDTGTYSLDGTWHRGVKDPFAPDTDDLKRGLSFLGSGYTDWAKAQEKTVFEQLEDGIRYLDIRVCVDRSGRLKTCHGLYGVSLVDVINDIMKFSKKYPKEPILVDFNHFYDWSEKERMGKENEAGYTGIRTSKLDELAGLLERSIGERMAPATLSPTSTLAELRATGRPIIVFWSKSPRGSFQQKYFWRSDQIPNAYSDNIKENRLDKINYLNSRVQAHQNTNSFFLLTGPITPSNDLYVKGNDPTSSFPHGLKELAAQSNPVVLSYVANEWKNLRHNIITVDFYNESGLIDLCKQLNGLAAKPKGVSLADRKQSKWGKWSEGVTGIFVPTSSNTYEVEIDACHSDLYHTETSNRITVQFWSGDRRIASRYQDGVAAGCKVWETHTTISLETREDITHVIIKTNGDDGFFIDKVRLYKGGKMKKQHGAENGNGWCLSTDAGDSTGSWKGKVAGNTCKPQYRFTY